jgi:hypothetical protein
MTDVKILLSKRQLVGPSCRGALCGQQPALIWSASYEGRELDVGIDHRLPLARTQWPIHPRTTSVFVRQVLEQSMAILPDAYLQVFSSFSPIVTRQEIEKVIVQPCNRGNGGLEAPRGVVATSTGEALLRDDRKSHVPNTDCKCRPLRLLASQ